MVIWDHCKQKKSLRINLYFFKSVYYQLRALNYYTVIKISREENISMESLLYSIQFTLCCSTRAYCSSLRRPWPQKTEPQIMKTATPCWSRAPLPRPGTETERTKQHQRRTPTSQMDSRRREIALQIFSCPPGAKACLAVLGEGWIAQGPPAPSGATLKKVSYNH